VQVIAVVVTASALLLSNSRGGFIATAAGLLGLFATTFRSRSGRSGYANWLAVAVAVVGFGFVAFSGGRVVDRLGDAATNSDVRVRLYELSLAALRDAAWLGTGYGTFPDVFQAYRTTDIGRPVLKAHNTYLDNAVELGVPATITLVLGAAWLVVICLRGIRDRNRDTIYPRLGVAISILVGLHAALDFTIEIPAIAAAFCLLLGGMVSQSWRSSHWQAPVSRRDPSPNAGAPIRTLRV
jgi:O-antigen ligase